MSKQQFAMLVAVCVGTLTAVVLAWMERRAALGDQEAPEEAK